MKAMILAAGLGTRLRPLTNDRPKALVRINGIPLLEIVIRRLQYFGINEIIINTHHFAGQIAEFLESRDYFGMTIEISHETPNILNTGGGLKKARSFFSDGLPFLLCNTDILSDLDIYKMYQQHIKTKSLVTLATRKRATSRYLVFDGQDRLNGWQNINTGDLKMCRAAAGDFQLRAFSGIQIIDPKLFTYFPKTDSFSIIDTYLKAAATETLTAFYHDDSLWLDVGKTHVIEEAGHLLEQLLENNVSQKFR